MAFGEYDGLPKAQNGVMRMIPTIPDTVETSSNLAIVPQERNTLLFSATMSPEIARISKKYLRDAKEITIGRKNESTNSVKHIAYMVQAKDKYAVLKRVADYCPQIYGIVFCRTRKETQEIADKLMQEGYNADSLHGELSQAQRDGIVIPEIEKIAR